MAAGACASVHPRPIGIQTKHDLLSQCEKCMNHQRPQFEPHLPLTFHKTMHRYRGHKTLPTLPFGHVCLPRLA